MRVVRHRLPLVVALAACARAGASPAPSPGAPPAPVTDVPLALVVPVPGIAPERVPDTFNAPRAGRPHRAVDILAARGTPVIAVADGEVFKIRNSAAGGLSVYALDASRHWMFYYAHLDRFRPGLGEGMKLAQGDTIGYVGTTGNAPPDTPHLHFQLMRARLDSQWWDGEAVDPRPFFVKTGEPR